MSIGADRRRDDRAHMMSGKVGLVHMPECSSASALGLFVLRRKVPASRGATRYLGDVMGQQSWEARAFGVRASALLAERFPTEKVIHWFRTNSGSILSSI